MWRWLREPKQATYNSQSSIAFRRYNGGCDYVYSGIPRSTAVYKRSFTVAGAQPLFTSVQAVPESPNLIVTVNGYDNTYSAGQLSFTFYDTSGKVIGSPIGFNAASDFQQLFFVGNTYGGLFSFKAISRLRGISRRWVR